MGVCSQAAETRRGRKQVFPLTHSVRGGARGVGGIEIKQKLGFDKEMCSTDVVTAGMDGWPRPVHHKQMRMFGKEN